MNHDLVIDVRGLSYHHPDGTQALSNVCLQQSAKEDLILFGPNGSGKTTLFLNLNGTLRGEGEVEITGLALTSRHLGEIRRRVGIVFQEADEQLFMPTVLEDVMFGLLNLGRTRRDAEERSRAILQEVGIPESLFQRPPYHLSAGEKRRVALAGVLAMDPHLLLLDEPTTSLDPPGQRVLVELLRRVRQPKLIATHDVHFARALSGKAAFLNAGTIIATGQTDHIIDEYSWNPYD